MSKLTNDQLEAIGARLVDEYDDPAVGSWEWLLRAAANDVDVLLSEVRRLKKEGSPGVMHKVDQAFYDLTVKERNYERQRVDRLQGEVKRLREALGEFDRYATPSEYNGTPFEAKVRALLDEQ